MNAEDIPLHFDNQNEENYHLQKNLIRKITLDETRDTSPDRIVLYDEPLIQFVDNIILQALKQNVSDIHIESHENHCRIRYRQHGILFSANEIPLALASRIITRLKVMANLNIAEKRLPQDGRFKLDTIDIRINTCPTLFGEKVVLRLLNFNHTPLDLTQLGLTKVQQTLFVDAISRPQGMVLVTGPTGSGKTVTLYSALNYLNTPEKNISTAEEPVEIRLPGVNQVNIHPKIGLTFSTALRAFLRQDPDIIMVGEIRDLETAEMAIQASRTGHLVLSTFHSNSAIETLTRMRAIGIPSHHIAESLTLVLASRLIRTLCDACKYPEKPGDHAVHYKATGCNQCTKGYKNRIAIYECLPVTEKIHQLILNEAGTQSFLSEARNDGFITLREMAMQQVANGITSLAEINRVLPR
ncbi:MAG TPA: ATPase, T2SS/T4P/T4SS family [Gammaproteobacteria bacterium]|nr:ATPase, T2SS/T4P/T4SS family [Gammaproteobacteria bacterium]